ACNLCQHFKKLSAFNIAANSFVLEHISRWPSLGRLETLEIASSGLSKSDFAILDRMQSLKTLRLGSATLDCDRIRHIAELPALEYLTLERVKIDGPCTNGTQGFRSLKSIVVNQSPQFDDEAIISFGQMPQLDEFNVHKTAI